MNLISTSCVLRIEEKLFQLCLTFIQAFVGQLIGRAPQSRAMLYECKEKTQ
jgi:hypothetical protein